MSDQSYPEPTVGIFIFKNDGKLLLLHSHKWPGRYTVPGGHVELGERLEQAAHREAREETGLEIRDLRFLCWQEFVYDPAFWKPRHFIFFDYACRVDSSDVQLNDEAEEFIWVEPEKALDLTLDHYTRVSVLEYLKLIGKGDSHD
jgi:nucleoside triphosphatase